MKQRKINMNEILYYVQFLSLITNVCGINGRDNIALLLYV